MKSTPCKTCYFCICLLSECSLEYFCSYHPYSFKTLLYLVIFCLLHHLCKETWILVICISHTKLGGCFLRYLVCKSLSAPKLPVLILLKKIYIHGGPLTLIFLHDTYYGYHLLSRKCFLWQSKIFLPAHWQHYLK